MSVMRVVVLDDYLQTVPSLGDWARLGPDVEVDAVTEHVEGDDLLARLAGAEVIVVHRERTVLGRELLAGLPSLRLIITGGRHNRTIDIDAATELGIVVSAMPRGHAQRGRPHRRADLGLDPRRPPAGTGVRRRPAAGRVADPARLRPRRASASASSASAGWARPWPGSGPPSTCRSGRGART